MKNQGTEPVTQAAGDPKKPLAEGRVNRVRSRFDEALSTPIPGVLPIYEMASRTLHMRAVGGRQEGEVYVGTFSVGTYVLTPFVACSDDDAAALTAGLYGHRLDVPLPMLAVHYPHCCSLDVAYRLMLWLSSQTELRNGLLRDGITRVMHIPDEDGAARLARTGPQRHPPMRDRVVQFMRNHRSRVRSGVHRAIQVGTQPTVGS